MSTPAVSICVPTYNGAAFIGRTIESALAQTAVDFELIVVDDASTDDTPNVVERYADPRLQFVRQHDNRGVAATWNHAVSLAKAPLVKLLCHDDTLEPACLSRQVLPFGEERVVLVSCWRRVIGPSGRTICVRRGLKRGRAIDRYAAVHSFVRSGTNLIGEPSATLFRKAAWEAAGGFSGDNLYVVDVDLWLKLLRHGRLAFVPEILCTYRVSPTALSTVLARRQIDAGRRLIAELAADPANRVSRAEARLGIARAVLRSWGRQAMYLAMRRPRTIA